MEATDKQAEAPCEVNQIPLINQNEQKPKQNQQKKQQQQKNQQQNQQKKQQQNQKQNQQKKNQQQGNAQPKEIAAKMREQDRFYESTLKALSSASINEDEEDDWGSSGDEDDFSQEAIERRRQEEISGSSVLQNITALSNEQKITAEIQNILSTSSSNSEKIQLITKLKSSEKMGDKLLTTILFEIFFTPSNILTQIKSSAPILSALSSSVQSQRCILGNIEKMVITNESSLLKRLNDIFFGFYENEILTEETLLDWLEVPDPSFVTIDQLNLLYENSMTFMNWLNQDDDEEEDEEEGDE